MKRSYFLEKLLLKGIEDGVFPAAASAIVKSDEILFATAGLTKMPEISPTTPFDVASLTKPVITTTLIFKTIEAGRLSLDSQIGDFLEETDETPWNSTTILQLLRHSSGLPSYRFFFLQFIKKGEKLKSSPSNKQKLLRMILKEKPVYQPDSKSEYSDFGFFILGVILEKMYAKTINEIWKENLPDYPIYFNPPLEIRKKIPPTEILSYRSHIQGEVHDEHSFLSGGLTGHAGAFISLKVLSIFIQGLIQNLHSDTIFSKEFWKYILSLKHPNSRWLPGWDTPSRPYSQGGTMIGNAIGHLGYTGCSIWIDTEQEIGVILLSNRTFPTRFNQKIKKYRPWFYDKVWETFKRR